jgi:hypothetical protein
MTGDVPGVTYIHCDLRPGMTIEWCEPPDYLDVTAVSDPDRDGMVTIDAVQGRFVIGGDCMFTEITPALADLIGAVVIAESERLP